MKARVAINGFGRIGRLVCRLFCLQQQDDIELVAINDLHSIDHLAYLLKFDSVHGRFSKEVQTLADGLLIDGKKIVVSAEKDPKNLPWKNLEVDYVIECTGLFTHYKDAEKHLQAGAKRVLISAPGKDHIPTFVMGVNEKSFQPAKDFILSNASCTTNCLAPLAKILLDHFGIEEALMTTIHAMTASQHVVDGAAGKDWRGGRSASQNIIPSSTGAAKAVSLCIPELKGKITGMAFRIPVIDVSAVDLTVRLSRDTTYEEICSVIKEASQTYMKNIVEYCEEEVVSTDFIGHRASAIFDRKAGIALNSRFYKLIAWYDNEMGYAARIVDLLRHIVD